MYNFMNLFTWRAHDAEMNLKVSLNRPALNILEISRWKNLQGF